VALAAAWIVTGPLEAVVTATGGAVGIVCAVASVKLRVVVNGAPTPVLLSMIFTVKVEAPGVVGVPLSTPVLAFNDNPGGSVPAEMLKV